MARKYMIRRFIQEQTTGQKNEVENLTCSTEGLTFSRPENTLVLPDYTVLQQFPKTKGYERKEKGIVERRFGKLQKLFRSTFVIY